MRISLLFIAVLLFVGLGSTSAPSVTNASNATYKERAITKFAYPVVLMGVPLQGEYLFVHDEAAMARGEACTFVYEGHTETPKKLVVSFHCLPVARERVETFTVRTSRIGREQYELREFQFAGSAEAHLVPLSQHAEHVTITSVY